MIHRALRSCRARAWGAFLGPAAVSHVSRGRQLYVRTGKRLRLTGTCVSTGRLEWFDHVATPHMAVCVAVRASSAIPFLFQASGRYTAIYTAI